jgi:Domain of unknown function (DUF4390)
VERKQVVARRGRRALGRRAAPLSLALLFAVAAIAAAQSRFEIRSAFVALRSGVYLLNAQLDFSLPEAAEAAIRDGVTLSLELEITVDRRRRLWPDETVATLEQHFELTYHALSERYLVRNRNSGEQSSFPTLEAALESLSVIRDLPILDRSLVDPQQPYEVNLRATIDVRSLPGALEILLFWVDTFKQSTDWYTWPLTL